MHTSSFVRENIKKIYTWGQDIIKLTFTASLRTFLLKTDFFSQTVSISVYQ